MWNDCTPAPTVCAHMSTHTRANVHTYVYLLGAGTVQVLLGGGFLNVWWALALGQP